MDSSLKFVLSIVAPLAALLLFGIGLAVVERMSEPPPTVEPAPPATPVEGRPYVRVVAGGPILIQPGGEIVAHARAGEVFAAGEGGDDAEWWPVRIVTGEDRYIARSILSGAEGMPVLPPRQMQEAIWRRIRKGEGLDPSALDRQALDILRTYQGQPAWWPTIAEDFDKLAAAKAAAKPRPTPPPAPSRATYLRAKVRTEIWTEPGGGEVLGDARLGDVFRAGNETSGGWQAIVLFSGEYRWIRSTAVGEAPKPPLPEEGIRQILYVAMIGVEREADMMAIAKYPSARTRADLLLQLTYNRLLTDKAGLVIFQSCNVSMALKGEIAWEGIQEGW
ncbi:MAG: hypothetical protein GY856_18075 [bacterium]|nr:hypothetical protein [bacterium]